MVRSALALILIAVVVSGFALVAGTSRLAAAQTQPSIPEFTVRYVDNSYDEPATYGIDPYTGKTVLIQEGFHVQNKSVELIIKNQPYHSYRNENGSLVWLYYAIAIKGHFEEWAYGDWSGKAINQKIYDTRPAGYIPSSEAEYTVLTYGLAGDNGTDTAYKYRSPTYHDKLYYGYYDRTLGNISEGGQVDFRVQAMIGYATRYDENITVPPIGLYPGEVPHYYIFTGQSSDWGSTQTITIPSALPSESPVAGPTPTSAPTQTVTSTPSLTTNPSIKPSSQGVSQAEFYTTIAIFAAVIVAMAAVIAVLAIKVKKTGSKQ